MDMTLYALLNKKIKGVASGIKSHLVVGTDLILTFNDGTSATISFPKPKDGVSIEKIEIDENTLELKYFLSDGTSGIAGTIPKGKDGSTPKINDTTKNWEINGIDTGIPATGPEGFSPSIRENENNSGDIYKLDITTKEGTFTTPNLKGGASTWSEVNDKPFETIGSDFTIVDDELKLADGVGGKIDAIKVNGVELPVKDKSVDIKIPEYIYIGNTEPTDENAVLWINPDESGGGTPSPTPENYYTKNETEELISENVQTLTDDEITNILSEIF